MKKTQSIKPNFIPVPGSPSLSKLNIDEQITWFDSSLRRWIFDPALLLLKTENPDVDFAVLAILNAIPEMLAQYQGFEKSHKGKDSDLKAYLYRKGIEYIFPDRGDHNVFADEGMIEKLLYGKLRSGIAHTGFTGERIVLTRQCPNLSRFLMDPVEDRGLPKGTKVLSVNVPEWYKQTKKRVDVYINDLRDLTKDELRQNFSERLTRGN